MSDIDMSKYTVPQDAMTITPRRLPNPLLDDSVPYQVAQLEKRLYADWDWDLQPEEFKMQIVDNQIIMSDVTLDFFKGKRLRIGWDKTNYLVYFGGLDTDDTARTAACESPLSGAYADSFVALLKKNSSRNSGVSEIAEDVDVIGKAVDPTTLVFDLRHILGKPIERGM